MNKIASFSTGRCSGCIRNFPCIAATSTVTGGYAQSDMRGKANKAGGFQPEIPLRAR